MKNNISKEDIIEAVVLNFFIIGVSLSGFEMFVNNKILGLIVIMPIIIKLLYTFKVTWYYTTLIIIELLLMSKYLSF